MVRVVYFLGILFTIVAVASVILGQIFVEYAKLEIENYEGDVHFVMPLIPGIINVTIIGILGLIYKHFSFKLAIGENHQYVTDFENSLSNKIYAFQFVNTYISNFVIILYD